MIIINVFFPIIKHWKNNEKKYLNSNFSKLTISRSSTAWWQPLTFFSGQATRGTSSASWRQAIERLGKLARWRLGQWHRSWWFSSVFYHVGPAVDLNVGCTVVVYTDHVRTDFGDLVPLFAPSTHLPTSYPCTA